MIERSVIDSADWADTICGNPDCGHARMFHYSAEDGSVQPCDVEVGSEEEVMLCGCKQFVEPNKF